MESIKLKAGRLKVKGLFRAVLGACILVLGAVTPGEAQTFAEWFSQGKTQIKYLGQQIAALQAFESSVKHGYNMLHSEWSAIGNFKNGEFGFHQGYYTALSTVNPLVKNNSGITAITAEQQMIVDQLNAVKQVRGLTAGEREYIESVARNLIAECGRDLDALQNLLNDGTLQMGDDERRAQLEKLRAAMLDKYRFTQSFCNAVRIMVARRNRETDQSQTLKQLYGINN